MSVPALRARLFTTNVKYRFKDEPFFVFATSRSTSHNMRVAFVHELPHFSAPVPRPPPSPRLA